MTAALFSHPAWRLYAAQIALFVVSRVAGQLSGLRLDVDLFRGCWQCIDFALLRTDTLRSLFWFHAQPPLYNAWVALALRQPLLRPRVFMELTLHGAALALVLALTALGRRVLPSAAAAFALGAVFSLSPALLIFELWPLYPVPTAALLVAAVWAVARGRVGLALTLMALTCWLRASFHPLWIVACAAPLVWVRDVPRRALALQVAAAVLVAALPSVRNAAYFGVAQQSTWFGMNLARAALPAMSIAERVAEVRAGRLSPVTLIAPFSDPAQYPDAFARAVAPSDAAVLNLLQNRSGVVNFNHVAYVDVSRQYASAARQVIAAHPGRFAGRVAQGALIYGHSPSLYVGTSPNGRKLIEWRRIYDAVVLGVPSAWLAPLPLRMRPSLASVSWLLLTLALVGAVSTTRALLVRRREGRFEFQDAALGVALITTAYATAVACALEFGENHRYRFEVEAFIFLFAAVGLARIVRRIAARSPQAGAASA